MKITTTTTRQLVIQMRETLETQHRDRMRYSTAKQKANATCAEFKTSSLSELIESGYMHGMGKQTASALVAADRWLADAGQPSDLVKRLRDTASKGISVWGDLQMEAAKEIEILTAEIELYAAAMDRMKKAAAGPEPDDMAAAMKQKTERLTP